MGGAAASGPVDLFGDAPRVFGSTPRDDVFAIVAVSLKDWALQQADPFALSACEVFVPNRRAARSLLQRFAESGSVGLAPVVRVLGDLETESLDALGQGEHGDITLDPAIGEAERLGLLAALSRPFLAENDRRRQAADGLPGLREPDAQVSPAACLAAARDLAALLDQASMSGVTQWPELSDLIDAADLAEHWQVSAQFLDVVKLHWPAILAARRRMDPGQRRVALIAASLERWQVSPPVHPVLVVGSTGSALWVRQLMRAVAGLPFGAVILPGLAPERADAAWDAVRVAPGHPLFALARTLDDLGVPIERVRRLDRVEPDKGQGESEARRRFVLEALAPAQVTADWRARLARLAAPESALSFTSRALSGLARVDVEDDAEEARLAAFLLREVLADPAKTACVVTPSPSIAMRIRLLLGRFGVQLHPSAGEPVGLSPLGRLAIATAHFLLRPCDPVALLTLLKASPALGYSEDPLRVWQLEQKFLRGPLRWTCLHDLAMRADELDPGLGAGVAKLAAWLADIRPDAGGHGVFGARQSARQHSECLGRLLERLAATPQDAEAAWRGDAGQALAKVLEDVAASLEPLGPVGMQDVIDEVLRLMSSRNLPPPPGDQPRLAILGPLEARLQHCDRVILAGLNEGIWPAPVAADPLLSRAFKRKIGLPDPDERLGLAAHDFAMLLGAREVFLLRASRVDNTPSVASRWLWRLDALAQAGGLSLPRRADLADLVRRLDEVAQPTPAARPEPKPPIAARPTRFRVSALGTLLRDPYAIYATDILRLHRLDPVGLEFEARDLGIAIHAVMDACGDPNTANTLTTEQLAERFRVALGADGLPEDMLRLWRTRLHQTAGVALDWLRRRPPLDQVMTELKAEWRPSTADLGVILPRPLTFVTRADRIEIRQGGLTVIDFKTGAVPSGSQMVSGREPQIGFTAAMALKGAFPGVPGLPILEAAAVALKPGGEPSFLRATGKAAGPNGATPTELAEYVLRKTLAAVLTYESETVGYLSRKMMLKVEDDGRFDRLARLEEWAGEDADLTDSSDDDELEVNSTGPDDGTGGGAT